ncbi:hypothetical protein [Pseudochelatococcus sp. G4_1912]|uniref:hypothetical protein n=1 Tax=Pseudochelatococcus sp. G4_1912 TaxID=3114288 RepID=UPI0039C659A4
MTEQSDVVSKSRFAMLCGVSPGRVTQWISEGKIDASGLEGEGRSARIRVKPASEQLRLRLGTSQRYGLNGLGTRLPDEGIEAPIHQPLSVEARIAAEKLAQAEMTTARMQREEMAARGIYTLSKDAQIEMTRLAGSMLTIFEGALPDFASAIAGQFELPSRDVLHLLRQQFRDVRERAASSCKNEAQDMPEFIEAADEAE